MKTRLSIRKACYKKKMDKARLNNIIILTKYLYNKKIVFII